jgi:hypothetical protein
MPPSSKTDEVNGCAGIMMEQCAAARKLPKANGAAIERAVRLSAAAINDTVGEFEEHVQEATATAAENGGGRDDEQYDEDEEDYDPTDMTAQELQRCERTIALMSPVLSLVRTAVTVMAGIPADGDGGVAVAVGVGVAGREAGGAPAVGAEAGAEAGAGAGALSDDASSVVLNLKLKQTASVQWGEDMATR